MNQQAEAVSLPATGFGRLFNGLVLFQVAVLVSIGNFSLQVYGAAIVPEESVARQVSWLFFCAAALYCIFVQRPFPEGWRRISVGLPLWLFIIYAYSSTVWSGAPSNTFKRTTLLVIVVLITASLNLHLERTRTSFRAALTPPLVVILVLSVLMLAAFPGIAITEIGWRGIATHKNEFGQLGAIGLFAYICRSSVTVRRGMPALLGMLAFAAALLLSRSATALIGVLATLSLIMLINLPAIFARTGAWRVPVLGGVALVLFATYGVLLFDAMLPVGQIISDILGAFGKSTTLTGRTKIWESVLALTSYHSTLLGGGYGGFWGGPDSFAAPLSRTPHLNHGQAHNGYLDVYNDLGLIGIALLALIVVSAFDRIRTAYLLLHPEASLHLAIVMFVLMLNVAESTLLRTNTFMNIVFLASYVRLNTICRAAGREKTRGKINPRLGHAGI